MRAGLSVSQLDTACGEQFFAPLVFPGMKRRQPAHSQAIAEGIPAAFSMVSDVPG